MLAIRRRRTAEPAFRPDSSPPCRKRSTFDSGQTRGKTHSAFAEKVATKRLPIFPFSGFDVYHNFRNDAFYDLYNLVDVRKTGKQDVVLLQPLPHMLYLNPKSHSLLVRPYSLDLSN
jgi:hypothetical protein